MEKSYSSTFTPMTEKEVPKMCPVCKEILPITSFRKTIGIRNNKEGIIRNYKCRKCESNNIDKSINFSHEKVDLINKQLLEYIEKNNKRIDSLVKKINSLESEKENWEMDKMIINKKIVNLEKKLNEYTDI